MDIRTVTDHFSASPQIDIADVATLAEAGFKTVICNRPDDEIPGQPSAQAMQTACEDAGLAFHFLPVFPGRFTLDLVEQLEAVLGSCEGPVLAYCRSGTRSTMLWGLASSSKAPSGPLMEAAAKAGYDLSPLCGAMDARFKENG